MEHSPARAIAAPNAPPNASPSGLIDRATRNLELLASRAESLPALPPDWAVRFQACLEKVPGPNPQSAIPNPQFPFPPTTDRTLASEAPTGVVIEGFNPPDLALAAWRATRAGADSYRAPICILQADPIEFLIGLALCDDRDMLLDPRCRFFVGSDGAANFEAFLRSRLDTALPRLLLRSPSLRAPFSPTPESILAGAHSAQQVEHAALRARISAGAQSTPRRHWATRFESAVAGRGEPLRILIPTTRYSTYVRHAAADLAAAFAALGHTARTLEEPTTDSRLASVGYLRAGLDFKPDLIVAINYVRAQLKGALPDHIPMVCWVQDRMPHLFDRALGASQGPLDFLVGHIHPSLYLDFGYPRDRALFRAVPASPRTFHTSPIGPDRARDLVCDVAYAGHQSESPEAMRDRMIPAFVGVPGLTDAARDIWETLTELAGRCALTPAILDTITRDALRARSIPLENQRAVETFDATYTRALAERIHRHQTLTWAAEICRARKWRMHLYGNGWDRHPTLSSSGRPALDHSEDLRCAYASARACLHASLASNAHQRITECALSGGLMLRRGPNPDYQLIKKLALRTILRTWGPGEPYEGRGTKCFKWRRDLPLDFDSPDWANPRALRLYDATGGTRFPRPVRNPDSTYTTEFFCTIHDIERDLPRLPDIPLWTFPDFAYPNALETSFRTRDELEHTLTRAITDPEWRASTITAHATVARDLWTTDRFAADLVTFLTERFRATLSAGGAAA